MFVLTPNKKIEKPSILHLIIIIIQSMNLIYCTLKLKENIGILGYKFSLCIKLVLLQLKALKNLFT